MYNLHILRRRKPNSEIDPTFLWIGFCPQYPHLCASDLIGLRAGDEILAYPVTQVISLGMLSTKTWRDNLKKDIILVFIIMLILTAITSSSDIQPNEIIAESDTEINESSTYTYIKDDPLIKVHIAHAFRGVDTDLAIADYVWQASDTDPSEVIINDSTERVFTSGTPLKLLEGYELAIKSIDIDGESVYLQLTKDEEAVNNSIIITPKTVDDLYTYTKGIGSNKSAELIKVHFENVFRGVHTLATIDRIRQVSENNSSLVIINSSDRTIVSERIPLKLKEGYELAILSIDIDGERAYLELIKNGDVIDSTIIIPPQAVEGAYNETVKAYEKQYPVDFAVDEGWDLYNQGKYDESIKAFDKAIELDPKNALAWNNKGRSLDNLGKYNEAIQAYNKVIEIDPKDAWPWIEKGYVLYNQGKYDEAIKAYDKAIELDSQYATAWNNKGNALNNQGKYDKAIQAYNRAIEINPQYADAWNSKGDALFNQGKYDEANQAYDKAIEVDPEYTDAWNSKGWALYNLEKYDEAIKAYDTAIELDSKFSWPWGNKGIVFYDLGKYNEAIKAYDKAIEINPEYEIAWYSKANALRMLHRNSEAEAAYAKARELGYNGIMTLMEMTAS